MKGKTMSKDILGSLVRVLITVPEDRLGLVQDVALKLSNGDGAQWEEPLKRFLRKESCWSNVKSAEMPAPKPRTDLLKLVSTIVIPATTGTFVAKEKFVQDTGRKAKVKVSYLGDDFTAWFLSDDGKTEEPITKQTLRYAKLRKGSVDGPIIAELGGEAKAEATLTEVFSLMEKQATGEEGVLLNNGRANLFYVKDQSGVLRAVFVRWHGDGWGVDADSVEGPGRWRGGGQVFSRNSVLKSGEPLAPAQA